MRLVRLIALALAIATAPAFAEDARTEAGMIIGTSEHDVATTTERLITALESEGVKIYGRIDHARGASNAGMELPPTMLVLFGKPSTGAALMQCDRKVGIDFPMKALIWEDEEGVWVGFEGPTFLQRRHDLDECDVPLDEIREALTQFATTATRAD